MIKVLLADDHIIFRDGIRSILENESDIEIIGEADDGMKAIKLTEELNPDIVLMDLTMEELNGIEATKLIKKNNPDVRVIALSMHLNRQIIVQALEAGVSGYVVKDASRAELVQSINAVYRGKQFLSSDVSDEVFSAINSDVHVE